MTVHRLKTWPKFFQAVKSGAKSFEVRVADRNFAVGDRLDLLEFDPAPGGGFTGAEYRVDVTYLIEDSQFILAGSVIMGIAPAPEEVAQLIADAIAEADSEFGYRIALTRLVDNVETWTLTMPGFSQDYEWREDAAEVLRLEQNRRRAVKVLAALRGRP